MNKGPLSTNKGSKSSMHMMCSETAKIITDIVIGPPKTKKANIDPSFLLINQQNISEFTKEKSPPQLNSKPSSFIKEHSDTSNPCDGFVEQKIQTKNYNIDDQDVDSLEHKDEAHDMNNLPEHFQHPSVTQDLSENRSDIINSSSQSGESDQSLEIFQHFISELDNILNKQTHEEKSDDEPSNELPNNSSAPNQLPHHHHDSNQQRHNQYSEDNDASKRPNIMFIGKEYLSKIFNDIDRDSDGQIDVNELNEALHLSAQNFQFDTRTVHILMDKYDSNRNGRLQFNEFCDLFMDINNQYMEFLNADQDSNGLVDTKELSHVLSRRGYCFSSDLHNTITYEITRRNDGNRMDFDLFVRVLVRFDCLRDRYNRMEPKFEKYINNSYFYF